MHKTLAAAIALLALSTSCMGQEKDRDDDSPAETTSLPTGIHMNEDGKKIPATQLKIWAISPLQLNENGVGFSVSYEHSLDKGGVVSYIIPAIATFDMSDVNYTSRMFYLMPGLKFYPTTWKGKIKYAVGPSILLGAGQVKNYNDYSTSLPYSSYQPGYEYGNKLQLGVMVNNYINFNPTAHLYLGLEFGFGFTYINRFEGKNIGLDATLQSCFKIGYRL